MASWPEPSSIGTQGGNPLKTYKLPNEKFEKFVGLKYDWQTTAKDTKAGGKVDNVEVKGSFRLEVTESRWQPSPSKMGGFGTFILKQKTAPSTGFKLQISASAFSFEAKVMELSAQPGKSAAPPSTASSVVIPLETKAADEPRLDEWRQRLEDAKAKAAAAAARSSPISSVTLSRPEGMPSSPNSLRLSPMRCSDDLDTQVSRIRSNSTFFQMSEARTMAQPEAEERPMLGLRVSGAGDTRVNGTYFPDPDLVGDQPTYRLQPDGDAKIYKLAGTWKLVHNDSPGYLYIGDGDHALGAVWTLGGSGRGPVPDFSASTWPLSMSYPELPTTAIPRASLLQAPASNGRWPQYEARTATGNSQEARHDRERPERLRQIGEDRKSRDAEMEARKKKLDEDRQRQDAEMEARKRQVEDRRKREAEAEARRAAHSKKPSQAAVASRAAAETAKAPTSPSEDHAPSLALRRAPRATSASSTPTDRAGRVPSGTTTVARAPASTAHTPAQSAVVIGATGGPTQKLAAASPKLVATSSKLATSSPKLAAASGVQKPAAKEDVKKDRERELAELMAKRKQEMMQRLATR